MQHGKPQREVENNDQPEAGEGQTGRDRVAERPVLLRRLSNASGGSGLSSEPTLKVGKDRRLGNLGL